VARRERPLFSIGAVARMLDLPSATIRTWESRYGLVVPTRSAGGQRLYSRDQIDQLRFVQEQLAEGRRPGEAHRLLGERVDRGDAFVSHARVVLAEQRRGAAVALRRLLGAERFEVVVADDPDVAIRTIEELEPAVAVLDTSDARFQALERRLRSSGTKVLPIEFLERPLALLKSAE
jgi:DNA-binding transcriptional MerR regulator